MFTSFANRPARDADSTLFHGALVVQGTTANGREWRRVFRSSTRFYAAAAEERAAFDAIGAEERAASELCAYRVIGSGPDARTETIRI